MKRSILTFAVLSIGAAHTALASGGSEAHGGSAIVCFSAANGPESPVDEVGRLTDFGRAHVQSAQPLDAYRASLSPRRNPRITSVLQADYATVLAALHATFSDIPAFARILNDAHTTLGDIESNGFATEAGLPDVQDSGLSIPLPRNCDQIQAAARQGDQILYDPVIWSHFSPFGKAVLQFHEELYYVTSEILKTAGGTSVGTQLMISSILTQDSSIADLLDRMTRYGFKPSDNPRYLSLEEWTAARDWTRTWLQDTIRALTPAGQAHELSDWNEQECERLYQIWSDPKRSTPAGTTMTPFFYPVAAVAGALQYAHRHSYTGTEELLQILKTLDDLQP